MAAATGESYLTECDLSVDQANRILLRLLEADIRFQIETDAGVKRDPGAGPAGDSRVRLFIHSGDVEAWQKIRREYFPG